MVLGQFATKPHGANCPLLCAVGQRLPSLVLRSCSQALPGSIIGSIISCATSDFIVERDLFRLSLDPQEVNGTSSVLQSATARHFKLLEFSDRAKLNA